MIETQRLILIPLTSAQLTLWAENMKQLEQELDFIYEGEPMTGIFQSIVKGQIERTAADEKNYWFHSFWLIIRKSDRVCVGSASFKNVPNEKGEVEIGYGLGKNHEKKGYMTESVEALCRWALQQEEVRHVIAETETEGFASQRILQKCGFELYKKEDTCSCWWRL